MNKNFGNDWRINNQGKYLYGKELECKAYEKVSETWDHDHCEFCWERIDSTTHNAFTDGKGHWICEQCYEDFKEIFKWKNKM